jgi:adenylosuccinate lyase
MDKIIADFSLKDAERVKEIERTTNHDVKAVEYFLKEQFEANQDLASQKEYLHFSCTSEDINNLAYALMLRHSFQDVILPALKDL